MGLISINQEQRLYVFDAGCRGDSLLGFDVAFERAKKVASWCGYQLPNPDFIGTPDGYAEYVALMQLGAEYAARTRTRCDADLTPQLIGLEGMRVEVTDKHDNTRRFWVGKSTGWMPVHIEIFRVNARGGSAVYGAPFKSVRVVRTK